MEAFFDVDVTLTLNGESEPVHFVRQTVDIQKTPPALMRDGDGGVSENHQAATVVWHEGSRNQLKNVAFARIVSSDGRVIIEGPVDSPGCYLHPDGVAFPVLAHGVSTTHFA